MVPIGGELNVKQLIQALRWKIDEEVADTESDSVIHQGTIDDALYIVSKLRERASPSPFINRLPIELLQDIFEILQEELPSRFSIFPPVSPSCWPSVTMQQIMSITSVCRYWRHITLGTPSLWQNIAVRMSSGHGKEGLTRLMMDRSNTLPLRIQNDMGEAGGKSANARKEFFLALLANTQRPTALFLKSRLSVMSDLFRPEVCLTSLTSLHLDILHINFDDEIHQHITPVMFPSLERLSLVGVHWGHQMTFPNLTHLSMITVRSISERYRSSYGELLEALQAMTLLEVVYMNYTPPLPLTRHAVDLLPFVTMRALKSIKFAGEIKAAPLFLLHNLSVPSTATIAWDVALPYDNSRFYDHYHQWHLPPRSILARVTRIAIHNFTQKNVVFEIHDDTIRVHLSNGNIDVVEAISIFLPNIRSLVFTGDLLENIEVLLGIFSSVEFVHCQLDVASQFRLAMIEKPGSQILPKLSELSFWVSPEDDVEGLMDGVSGFDSQMKEKLINSNELGRRRDGLGNNRYSVTLRYGVMDSLKDRKGWDIPFW